MKSSDAKLLIMLVCIGAAVGSWVYCTNSLQPKTEMIKNENAALQTEVDYLQDLMNNKQFYIDETESMRAQSEEIMDQFPADVKTETQIMYANDLELTNAFVVEDVTMPGKEMVTVATATTEQPVATDAAATDAVATDDTATQPAGSSLETSVMLYRNPTTIGFRTTYKSIKDIIKVLNESTVDKKSIELLSLAYDEETGNLKGELQVAMYSMDGNGKEYVAPSVTGVKNGSDNIFKSSENADVMWTTTTADSTKVKTQTENSEDEESEDNKESEDKE